MSLIRTVTTTRSVSPIGWTLVPQLLRQPAGKETRQRLTLLLAVDDRLVQEPEPLLEGAALALAETPVASFFMKTASTSAASTASAERRGPPRWP